MDNNKSGEKKLSCFAIVKGDKMHYGVSLETPHQWQSGILQKNSTHAFMFTF